MPSPRPAALAALLAATALAASACAGSAATDTAVTGTAATEAAVTAPDPDAPDPTATALPDPAQPPAGDVGHDEGPGTDTTPAQPQTGDVGHDEGPGTDTAPAQPPTGEVGHDEGPGTGTVPADAPLPIHDELPSTWQVTGVPAGEVLTAHGDPDIGGAVVGRFPADAIDIQSTGRVAGEGPVWREVEVPGATVGWVLADHLVEQGPQS